MESRTRPIPTATGLSRPPTRRREVELDGLTWIDVPQPVSADLAYLRERLRLDQLALEAVLSTIQRPKLNVYDAQEYLFLIVQVPVFDRDQHIIVSEIDLFAGRDFVVTIHDGSVKALRRLFAAATTDEAARKQLLSRGAGHLLYRVLDTLVKQGFPIIYHLDEEFGRLNSRVFSYETSKLLQVQSVLERDLIMLGQIIEPNVGVCAALAQQSLPFLRADSKRFFADAADGMHKLHDVASERRALVASLGTTIATRSIQQHSQIQQYILIVLLILAPFLVLAALAALAAIAPPREQPLIFAGATLATITLAAGLVAFARSRRWV